MVEEFSKQFLQVLDNPKAFEPKIVFLKRKKTGYLSVCQWHLEQHFF
jgi:hypothetical protein